jgi:hypothetical protein
MPPVKLPRRWATTVSTAKKLRVLMSTDSGTVPPFANEEGTSSLTYKWGISTPRLGQSPGQRLALGSPSMARVDRQHRAATIPIPNCSRLGDDQCRSISGSPPASDDSHRNALGSAARAGSGFPACADPAASHGLRPILHGDRAIDVVSACRRPLRGRWPSGYAEWVCQPDSALAGRQGQAADSIPSTHSSRAVNRTPGRGLSETLCNCVI